MYAPGAQMRKDDLGPHYDYYYYSIDVNQAGDWELQTNYLSIKKKKVSIIAEQNRRPQSNGQRGLGVAESSSKGRPFFWRHVDVHAQSQIFPFHFPPAMPL